ncbi:sensor histidine kinase [Anaerobacillus sp. CMMVII]|uniref:two-component system sensor histidine kinase NtrB n=1 Tax=Anaerobacillus sp. CMMVII TaxID=2755588 RepID=UPI0021B823E0|nr:ATP-binding protein [Anaerobacillus sp. CMMVII]MCT8137707.1 sensor histidine kinase [Anaerobacillus sp. CMMVII]
MFKTITKPYLFIFIVSLIGCSLFVLHNNYLLNVNDWLLFSLLTIAIILLNKYTILLPHKGNSLCMDTAIYIAVLFIFGLEMTLSLLFFSNLLFAIFNRRTVWWKHVFNFSMLTIMVTCSYYVFIISGGLIGSINLASTLFYVLSLVVYFSINILAISLFFLLSNPSLGSLLVVLKEVAQESIGNYIVTLASAFVLAIIFENNPLFGTFIFTFVIILSSLAFIKYFHLYEQMSTDKIYQEQILNSVPIGIITVENKTSEFFLNSTAKSLLDIDEDKIKGLAEKDKSGNEYFWSIFSSKKSCQNVKVPYKTNERNHLLLVSQSPLYDKDRKSIGRNFYFIDITETAELEQRMYQSEKLAVLGGLAAGAAHEIRNPLAVIHGFLTLMKKSFSERQQEKYFLPLMLSEFDRINLIIEEMLLLAKPGSPKFREISISTIISEIYDFYHQSPSGNEIQFKVNLVDVALLLDEKQIKQVLYNLIRNSYDAMNGNGSITIFSKVEKDTYRLFIQDNGPGIPKDLQQSIFDPFLTTKETGTGLGLTIVQRIIENHQGSIQLSSSSEAGTTFVISLPLIKTKTLATESPLRMIE